MVLWDCWEQMPLQLDQLLGEHAQTALASNRLPNPRTLWAWWQFLQPAGGQGRKTGFKKPPTPSSTFSYFKADTRGRRLPKFLVLCMSSHIPPGLGCQSPGRGIGKKMSLNSPSPQLRKKQSNNYNSNMRMVLQQVVAAWQKIVA